MDGSSPAGFSHLAGRREKGAREIGVKRATVRTQSRTERHSGKSDRVGVAMVNGVTIGSFCLLVLITLNVGPLLLPSWV